MTLSQRLRRGRGWSTPWVALARFANALYFLLTASYCVLTYSSFAYQQFIRPRLVASLTAFIVWHPLWHWLALAATAATLVPLLKDGGARWVARGYVGAMVALGVVLTISPVLPSVENDGFGLTLAALFLIPPFWLAVCDHLATAGRIVLEKSAAARVLRAALWTAVFSWACGLLAVPFRLRWLGDLPFGSDELVFGALVSLLVHAALFGGLGLLSAAAIAITRRPHAEYWATAGISAAVVWGIVNNLVFRSLSFHGAIAALLAAELAIVLAAVWSGVARLYVAADFSRHVDDPADRSVFGAWLAPFGITSGRLAIAGLIAVPLATFLLVQRASTFDWNFLFQNLLVMAAWLAAIAALFAMVPRTPAPVRAVPAALAAGVLLAVGAARGTAASALDAGLARRSFVPEFALDAYAAVEPSYRLIRHLLWVEPPGSAAFFATLRANSLIQHVDVPPIDIDFVPPPIAPTASTPPDIYLLVIDSLRRDYVAAYNPAVRFTPNMAAFAAEPDTLTFKRHFARYGGTGLSMAAMWSGGMVLHKEYITPFAPMDALGKLLRANGYHAIASPDHITEELIAPAMPIERIDTDRDEMEYDFCGSLGQMAQKVAARRRDEPVFGHTRSLNLHVSKLANSRASAPGERFVPAAAEQIGRMDACFGRFVRFLKDAGRYDRSIVILTSDHGDSLGEAMRWGHSYTLYPEIVRTPLLIHVPAEWRRGRSAAVDHATFSTDITPSLYALLGYTPAAKGWIYGVPMFTAAGHEAIHQGERVLVASSYGPVYGVIDDDGQTMYVADAVNARDFAYDLSALVPRRIGVTAGQRETSRAWIAERLGELARSYRFSPAP
jgi:hypothetical protein